MPIILHIVSSCPNKNRSYITLLCALIYFMVFFFHLQYSTVQYSIRYHTTGYNTIQYSVQYNTRQYNTIKSIPIQYNTIQCNATQYNTIQYNTSHYTTMQVNTILYSIHKNASIKSNTESIYYYLLTAYRMTYNNSSLWWGVATSHP